MKIEPLKEVWLKEYVAMFNASLPKEFETTQNIFREKVWNSPDFYEKASKAIIDEHNMPVGFLVIKKSQHPEVDGKIAWISAFFIKKDNRKNGYATQLFQQAERTLKDEGIEKIFVGQEYDNFFSGIPAPSEESATFFKKMGFWLNDSDHYDLEADVQKITTIDSFDVSKYETEFFTDELHADEKQEVLTFLEKEFPGRWHYEVKTYLEEEKPLSHIVVLRKKDTLAIKGFCMLSVAKDKRGGLGPIGIGKDVRGKTVGNYILCKSMQQLRKLGGETTCIDWTLLKSFYGQFEFAPVRTYLGSCKNI